MKGDDIIKNITIKVLGLGNNKNIQAKIYIYSNNKCIYECITNNAVINIELCNNEVYKIKAILLNQKIEKIIFINNYTNIYYLTFNLFKQQNNTFLLLKDYYYNLPIERGELILWQK